MNTRSQIMALKIQTLEQQTKNLLTSDKQPTSQVPSVPLDVDFSVFLKKEANSTLLGKIIKARRTNGETMAVDFSHCFFPLSFSVGANKPLFERLLSLVRSQPRYLALMVQALPFTKVDTLVNLLNTSFYSDLFLVKEEMAYLTLMRVNNNGCTKDNNSFVNFSPPFFFVAFN
jgi:hypothetical protein